MREPAMARTGVRVASYNTHGGIGTDGHFVPRRIAEVLREVDADVIALQEIESRASGFDMLEYLKQETGFEAVWGPTFLRKGADYGNGLLTRFKVLSVKRLDLTVGRREPRGVIDVELQCGENDLRVLATHLGLRPSERREQIERLLAVLEGDRPLPTVLMGDINEWWLWGRPLRWMHRHFEKTPAPRTFPSRWPILSLDRIWCKPRTLLERLWAHRSRTARAASDHLPVAAQLALACTVADEFREAEPRLARAAAPASTLPVGEERRAARRRDV
jgi:endonuclease/exonuclease/phosphatase family metal-dependent hydrolase